MFGPCRCGGEAEGYWVAARDHRLLRSGSAWVVPGVGWVLMGALHHIYITLSGKNVLIVVVRSNDKASNTAFRRSIECWFFQRVWLYGC